MAYGYMEHFVVQTKNINFAWMWMVINIFEIFTTIPLMLAAAPLTVCSPSLTSVILTHHLGN